MNGKITLSFFIQFNQHITRLETQHMSKMWKRIAIAVSWLVLEKCRYKNEIGGRVKKTDKKLALKHSVIEKGTEVWQFAAAAAADNGFWGSAVDQVLKIQRDYALER